MDPLDDEIGRLLLLKRYERPHAGYFENFLHEFRRRQRDELVRQPLWRICFERGEGFALRFNIRPVATAGIAVVVACAAVISVRLHQQPDTIQLAAQESPVPSTPSNTENELHLPAPVFNPTFEMRPTLRPPTRNIPGLPVDSLAPDQFVFPKLEWESLNDQSLLEK
jgi:hypothetical protein